MPTGGKVLSCLPAVLLWQAGRLGQVEGFLASGGVYRPRGSG